MAEPSRPHVIAGLPAYNEGKYIGTLVLDTRQHVDEVIVVDDGSSDNTAKIASLAGADVIRHPKNLGYGAAIQSLINAARERDADVLVILDADFQHDPQEIPNLLQPITEGYDCVIGSRKNEAAKIPLYRRFGQRVISNSLNVLSGKELADSECGFRAFSRKAICDLNLRQDGMAVSAETIAEAARHNLKVTQVPVSVSYHKDSSTLNPISHGLGVFTRILVMISEQKPLFFFGMTGVFLMVIGLVSGIYTLQLYSISRVVSTGWALVSVLFLTTGAASFITGLLLRAISNMIRDAVSRGKR